MLPQKKKKPAGSSIQANTKNSNLKFAFAFSAVLAIAAAGAMAQETVLKGKILKELNAKPNADLVDRYGEAATDPAIADALRKAQGKTNSAEAKTRADAYEALQNGVWTAGADPTMAIMNGFVPPNMSPEQAAIMSQYLPKMPRMPHLLSPEQMAGEPNPDMFLPGNPEPMSPYIPIPDSVATRQPRTRQLPLIPGPLSAESFIGGLGTPPHMMGVPIMPYGAGRKAIEEANQRQVEDYLRDRFGPGYPSPFQKNHNRPAVKPAKEHIAESDHQSVVGVCDENGNEITAIQYDPWGQHTVLSGGSVMPTFMYKGMYWHERSQKYLTLHRVYDPALGRWLSRDPLGERAGTNLYAYCGNDPINRRDPLGLYVVGTYSQSAHTFSAYDTDYAGPTFSSTDIFSGNGMYGDNSFFQAAGGRGPIPQGEYFIEPKIPIPGEANYEYPLNALSPGIETFMGIPWSSRGGFTIHPGLRSNGCVTFKSKVPEDAANYPTNPDFDSLSNMLDRTNPLNFNGVSVRGILRVVP